MGREAHTQYVHQENGSAGVIEDAGDATKYWSNSAVLENLDRETFWARIFLQID